MATKTVDAAAAASNWQKGMAGASAAYQAGIQGTTVNPMQLAASPAAMQAYVDGVQRSIANGKRQRSLQSADVNTWKQNATTVGAARLASGAQKALPKVQAFFAKWAPIYQQASAAANALPKGGLGNAVARAQAAIQVLMQNAGTA